MQSSLEPVSREEPTSTGQSLTVTHLLETGFISGGGGGESFNCIHTNTWLTAHTHTHTPTRQTHISPSPSPSLPVCLSDCVEDLQLLLDCLKYHSHRHGSPQRQALATLATMCSNDSK